MTIFFLNNSEHDQKENHTQRKEPSRRFQPLFTLSKNRTHAALLRGLAVLLLLASIGFLFVVQRFQVHATSSLLPGEHLWQQGVSSWLFGTNDASWRWSSSNPGSNAAIAAVAKATGITVIRTPLQASDYQARIAVVEAAGAQCLGILQPADAEQVVQALGSRCNLYEWMNEPDTAGLSATQYAATWNQEIPKLRAINPQALFIGPVVASPNRDYITHFLTAAKASGNLPDLVSYHMYPCTDQSISTCPAHIGDYGQAAQAVDTAVQAVVGYHLPLAVTEWNYSWKSGQTPQQDPFMATFTQQSLQAMAQAGIVLANQFDLASNAGGGTLDMVSPQNGQSTPQLQAMQAMIAHYQTDTATSTASPIGDTPIASTTPVVPGTPDIMNSGMLLSAQQVACPAAPLPVVAGTATPIPSRTTVIPQTSATPSPQGTVTPLPTSIASANACTFLTHLTTNGSVQQVVLTWWNEGMTSPSDVQIALSGDSTDGSNGTWTSWPSALTGGGFQVLSVPGSTQWIAVHLEVPSLCRWPHNRRRRTLCALFANDPSGNNANADGQCASYNSYAVANCYLTAQLIFEERRWKK